LAARLAPQHTVVVLDRTDGPTARTALSVLADVVVDLVDPDVVRRAATLVLDRYGRCDVLVHAAAMVVFGPLKQFGVETWRQMQPVNVESALLLSQAFISAMRDRGFGRVIFIVSPRRGTWSTR
jgi:NAD(P)-dependent dehydrogenase (short-subunit alcohol dehydrogenase family)